jgi:hypothetical protein
MIQVTCESLWCQRHKSNWKDQREKFHIIILCHHDFGLKKEAFFCIFPYVERTLLEVNLLPVMILFYQRFWYKKRVEKWVKVCKSPTSCVIHNISLSTRFFLSSFLSSTTSNIIIYNFQAKEDDFSI